VTPYYDRDGITIHHADCRDVLPTIDPASVDLLLTDPPYGMGWDTDYNGRGMGALAQAQTYAPVAGDDTPFDPAPLLRYPRLVLFGANHYADRLPTSAGWLIWDKSGNGRHVNDLSDAELAWTNVTGAVRTYNHLWKGMLKDSERDAVRVHPTQKPVALMAWVLNRWTKPGDLILDPYMGSGPIARAAQLLGRRYIGIELVEDYCKAAVNRLAQPSMFTDAA
jgi:site-specific DNA-methyltransferase (adenine-specific)